MITRIITVGPQRLGNLLLTLCFDHYLNPRPEHTVVITPLDVAVVHQIISDYHPELSVAVVADHKLAENYDLSQWQDQKNLRAGWLRQQALKLVALDCIDTDLFLIQDPDTFCIQNYTWCSQGSCILAVQENQSHYSGYYQTLETVLGITRQTNNSFVTEFMPCYKQDWMACRDRIEQIIDRNWTNLIDYVPLENFGRHCQVRWFSEYELLGNWQSWLRPTQQVIQKRFVYNSIESLEDLNTTYTVVCDRGPHGQIRGLPSLFGDQLTVDFQAIDQAKQILRNKQIC